MTSSALYVTLSGLGTIIGESYSAGRLYDKIGDTAAGVVTYIFGHGAVAAIEIKE